MSTVSIDTAKRRYGGKTEAETLQNMARAIGCSKIFKYKSLGSDVYDNYKRIETPSDELGLFTSPYVIDPVLVYDKGKFLNL